MREQMLPEDAALPSIVANEKRHLSEVLSASRHGSTSLPQRTICCWNLPSLLTTNICEDDN